MPSALVRIGAATLGLGLVASLVTIHNAGAANEPYFIGAVLSESGPGATLGRPNADSVQLAVDEINKAGGVNGHPLQVQILDDASSPTTAVSNVRQLLDKKPIAIIGSSLTQGTLAMEPLVDAAGIPLISLASSGQIIEPASAHKWDFKMPITDTKVGQVIQSFLRKKKAMKVAFIYRDDDYGKTGLEHFKNGPDSKGFEVVSSDAISASASDATTQLTHAKGGGANALVAWTTMPSAYVVLKAYRELAPGYPIVYSDGAATAAFPTNAGAAINGVFIASTKITVVGELGASDPQKKVLEHYIDAFNRAYPKDGISIFGGFGYDSVYVLKAAIERAKSGDPAKVRDALEHVTYPGVTGTFRITPNDHNGLGTDSLVVTELQNQKFTIAK
jgi:branched-chain amino acid transport system substrate-binding protein